MKYISLVFSFLILMGIGLFSTSSAHAQAVPAGCTSTAGYSTINGLPCNGVTVSPIGCPSTSGFSTSTGQPCNGATFAANGYAGTPFTQAGFLNGCVSTAGFSSTSGLPCYITQSGVVTPPPVVPSLPTTGAGGNASSNVIVLALAALTIASGVAYGLRMNRS